MFVFMDSPPVIKPIQLSSADLEQLSYLRSIKPARSTILRPSSRGERIADLVTNIVGSWRFIIIQSCLLTIWIVLNVIGWIAHWDPYPFILLNLALSFQAAYATPFILMSQNRQSSIDRDNAQQDLDCDLKAEMEIELLHEKLDSLRAKEIADLHLLIQTQSETISKIERMLARKMNTDRPPKQDI
jgi:uncharacterized membrane protein